MERERNWLSSTRWYLSEAENQLQTLEPSRLGRGKEGGRKLKAVRPTWGGSPDLGGACNHGEEAGPGAALGVAK